MLLLLAAGSVVAQKPPIINGIFPETNQLKFSLNTVADPVNPGFELSYEKQYAGRFATQAGITLMSLGLKKVMDAGDHPLRFSGFRISLEEKFFVPTRTIRRVHPYFSAELTHLSVEAELDRGVNKTPPIYSYHRRTWAANLKFGMEIPIWTSFILDIAAGMGLKQRIVESNYVPPIRRGGPVLGEFLEYAPFNATTFNLPGTIRIGYMF
ncbi:hypothetical protein DLD77_07710 [Chitinophaga alhagiae]|uniref:DUF3575 domain-containing protein n=1 Tax=Chitinophaga alhagiae TaxID=2203219 RepID=A0ABM6WCB8_9BACT|nr:hypothetical protein DLD77_07710 [Chitinophaga alhagiae]